MVGDDGVGGAQLTPEGGLAGIERRLAAFDGTLSMASPLGGPTIVTIKVPCALRAAGRRLIRSPPVNAATPGVGDVGRGRAAAR